MSKNDTTLESSLTSEHLDLINKADKSLKNAVAAVRSADCVSKKIDGPKHAGEHTQARVKAWEQDLSKLETCRQRLEYFRYWIMANYETTDQLLVLWWNKYIFLEVAPKGVSDARALCVTYDTGHEEHRAHAFGFPNANELMGIYGKIINVCQEMDRTVKDREAKINKEKHLAAVPTANYRDGPEVYRPGNVDFIHASHSQNSPHGRSAREAARAYWNHHPQENLQLLNEAVRNEALRNEALRNERKRRLSSESQSDSKHGGKRPKTS